MKWSYVCFFLLCFLPVRLLAEGWSETDSTARPSVAERKDTIRLRPEIRKAIEEGTFLRMGPPRELREPEAKPSLPISKDFSEYFHSEDTVRHQKRRLVDLPPGVTMLYGNDKIRLPDKPLFRYYAGEVEELKQLTPGGLVTFSAEDLLEQIFWKSARAKRRNKKKANAWRYYNEIP